jgi:YEATS family
LPLVYGSIAFPIAKPQNKGSLSSSATGTDDFSTHQWTLYLRGPNNEDLSPVIEKVVFQLHASFAQPIRELYPSSQGSGQQTQALEVTERGWGEFEAQIRVHWKDSEEQPVVVRTRTCFDGTGLINACQMLALTRIFFSFVRIHSSDDS